MTKEHRILTLLMVCFLICSCNPKKDSDTNRVILKIAHAKASLRSQRLIYEIENIARRRGTPFRDSSLLSMIKMNRNFNEVNDFLAQSNFIYNSDKSFFAHTKKMIYFLEHPAPFRDSNTTKNRQLFTNYIFSVSLLEEKFIEYSFTYFRPPHFSFFPKTYKEKDTVAIHQEFPILVIPGVFKPTKRNVKLTSFYVVREGGKSDIPITSEQIGGLFLFKLTPPQKGHYTLVGQYNVISTILNDTLPMQFKDHFYVK